MLKEKNRRLRMEDNRKEHKLTSLMVENTTLKDEISKLQEENIALMEKNEGGELVNMLEGRMAGGSDVRRSKMDGRFVPSPKLSI